MAVVTHRVTTGDSANTTSYPSGSFTPASGEVLISIVMASSTITTTPTMTDSQGLGFTLVHQALWDASTSRIWVFASNATAAASAMTVTFNCPLDAATGCLIYVAGVGPMPHVGAAAIKQVAKQEDQLSGATPAPTFPAACQNGNPTIGAVATNASGSTTNFNAPTGWTELGDTTFGPGSPNKAMQYVARSSGFTGTTITWPTAATVRWGAVAIELNAETAFTNTGAGTITTSGTATVSRGVADTGSGTKTFSGTLAREETHSVAASGTATTSGTATEAKRYVDTASGTLTSSGTASVAKTYTDVRSGTETLSGTVALSESFTDAPTGTLAVAGTEIEERTHTDTGAGTVTESGTATESLTESEQDVGTGTVSLTGTATSATTYTDARSGVVVCSGTAQLARLYTDARSGLLTLTGRIPQQNVDARTGALHVSGAAVESYGPTSEVEENWPPSSDVRWQQEPDDRWEMASVT